MGREKNLLSKQKKNFKHLNDFIEQYRFPNIPSCGGDDLLYGQHHNGEKYKKKKKYLSSSYNDDEQKDLGNIRNYPLII